MSVRTRTIRGAGWSGLSQFIRLAAAVIATTILARLLEPSDFGVVATVLVFTALPTLLAEMGITPALVQAKQVGREFVATAQWLTLASGIAFFLVIWVTAPLVAQFYPREDLVALLRIASLGPPVAALGAVPRGLLSRRLKFKSLAIGEMAGHIAGGLCAIALAIYGIGAASLVFGPILGMAVTTLALVFVAQVKPLFLFSRTSLVDLWSFGRGQMGFYAVNYWSRSVDDLVIGRYVSMAALGNYSRAYQVMVAPITQVTAMAAVSMLPALSRSQDDHKQARHRYLSTIRIIALFSFPAMAIVGVLGPELTRLILGPGWEQAGRLVTILAVAGLPQTVGSTTGLLYQSQGRTRELLHWGLIVAVATTIAVAAGLPWGVVGVATGYAVRTWVLFPLNFQLGGRWIGLPASAAIRELFPMFVCSLGGAMVSRVTANVLGGTGAGQSVVVAGIFGVAGYLIAVWFVRPSVLVEARGTLRILLWAASDD